MTGQRSIAIKEINWLWVVGCWSWVLGDFLLYYRQSTTLNRDTRTRRRTLLDMLMWAMGKKIRFVHKVAGITIYDCTTDKRVYGQNGFLTKTISMACQPRDIPCACHRARCLPGFLRCGLCGAIPCRDDSDLYHLLC